MYPNRCYDCLAAIPLDDLLCARCQKIYADERARRQGGRVTDEK
jgi:predicted nucleic acid-binding Zn ribbon protein